MDFKIPKLDELKERIGVTSSNAGSRTRSVRDVISSVGGNNAGSTRSSRTGDAYDNYDEDLYEPGDYGEYGFDDNADYGQVNSAATTSSFRPTTPALVSSDDVRAYTQYTPPTAEASSQRQSGAGREFSAIPEEAHRSPGVNSLFQPSTPAQTQETAPNVTPSRYASGAASQTQAVPSVPTDSAEGRVVQRAARVITLLEPKSYDEIERLVRVLKAGDVAVVSLKKTPEDLSKRLLDFAFGVACALDAGVECPAAKVYAFARGNALSESELARMKSQGLV